MGKNKRYNRKNIKVEKEKKKLLSKKNILVWFLVLIVMVGIFIAYMNIEGKIAQYDKTINELSTEIRDLKKTNKSLEDQMDSINSDEYIERIARERLGMVKKGEIVLKQSDQEEEENEKKNNKKK